jgi:glycosyltransferase involved in cell wall biosynthesis
LKILSAVPKVSVTVITRNEAADIVAALESVAWADEVVVVDSRSEDETVRIARNFTDRVFVRDWTGYIDQKNYAATLARHDWILSLDADERVTQALADEIRELLRQEPVARGYRVPRVTHHLGRWIRSTDWYPDYQLRLYDRRAGRWSGRYVHESVQVDGAVGVLRNELQHYPYRDISDHLETIDRYTAAGIPAKLRGQAWIPRRGSRTSDFGLELVLRVPQIREALAPGTE